MVINIGSISIAIFSISQILWCVNWIQIFIVLLVSFNVFVLYIIQRSLLKWKKFMYYIYSVDVLYSIDLLIIEGLLYDSMLTLDSIAHRFEVSPNAKMPYAFIGEQ